MIGAAALSAAAPGDAAWHKASSAHFVVYADESPAKLHEFATRLEKFDKAVRYIRQMRDHPVGDGNRLQVFIVPTVQDVRKLGNRTSGLSPNFIGFYRGRAEGSIAVVPDKLESGMNDDDRFLIFFHEYAHHLMFQDLNVAIPLWYSEGFAEFMSTASIGKDGSVSLGRQAIHRARDVDDSRTLPLERIFSGKHEKLSEDEWGALYARSWLLTHYLTFESSRLGQLKRYLNDFADGKDGLQTAQAAFGDFQALNRNLHGYLGRNKITSIKVAAEALPIGPVDIQPLSPGAAEVIMLRARSKAGVAPESAAAHAQQVLAIAARYPDDPLVQATLAEAEFNAHNYPAAEAAADKALAANPNMIEAMIFKGRAILERAAQDDKSAAFADARGWFMKANKLDPEDPEPLMLFHQAQVRDSGRASANGIAALHYASDLAPQDLGLRTQSAFQYLRDGKLAEARKALAPVAYNPHGGTHASMAAKAIERIDAGDGKGAARAMTAGN
jgi:tetratricopeptide (TPR) repeat protein